MTLREATRIVQALPARTLEALAVWSMKRIDHKIELDFRRLAAVKQSRRPIDRNK
jgi:hypothetical protein